MSAEKKFLSGYISYICGVSAPKHSQHKTFLSLQTGPESNLLKHIIDR